MSSSKRRAPRAPLVALLPLLAVLAWPRAPHAVDAEEARLAPWRVRFPQVEFVRADEVAPADLLVTVFDAQAEGAAPRGGLAAGFDRAQLRALRAASGTRRLVFLAEDRPELALRAALQAQVWGWREVYARV